MRQSREIELLKQDCTTQEKRWMKVNVLIHKLPEQKDENCETLIQDLLKKVQYTEAYEIITAHRLGTYNDKFSRPVIVRLGKQTQAEALIRFGSKADGIKVTPQYPTEVRERRRQLGEIAEGARKKEKMLQQRLWGTLYT